MVEKIDWIEIVIKDRTSMVKTMRENTASDVLNGYSLGQIAHQMAEIENYERETKYLINKFKSSKSGNVDAYFYLKKIGAIA